MFVLILFYIRWICYLISSGTGIVYVNIFYDFWFPRGSLTYLEIYCYAFEYFIIYFIYLRVNGIVLTFITLSRDLFQQWACICWVVNSFTQLQYQVKGLRLHIIICCIYNIHITQYTVPLFFVTYRISVITVNQL